MKSRIFAATALVTSLALAMPATAQTQQERAQRILGEQVRALIQGEPGGAEQAQRMIQEWPDASRRAADQMIQSYGPPDGVTQEMLVWRNNGPWHQSMVMRDPVEHNFPMPHQDVLAQTIFYDVPVDAFGDLAQFDGSIIIDRTKGTITSRCDTEAANFLALNLAHEIVRGDRSIAEARRFLAEEMDDFTRTGETSRYLRGLQFRPLTAAVAGDPDQPSRFIAARDD